MDKYAGYLFCGECGSKLYIQRAYSLTESQNNFMCGGYQGKKIDCTAHYIRKCILDQIVLEKLRVLIPFARENPDGFYALAAQNGEAEAKKFYQTAKKKRRGSKPVSRSLTILFAVCMKTVFADESLHNDMTPWQLDTNRSRQS